MTQQLACPDERALKELLLGRLSGVELSSLEEHFAGCTRCAETAKVLSAEDTLCMAMRAAGNWDQPESVELSELITRIVSRVPVGDTVLDSEADTRLSASAAECRLEWDHDLTSFLAPAETPDEMGRLGGYRVLGLLGVGGMGAVFEAEDPQLKRRVALKVMKPALATSASARQRFLREAQSAAAVHHDHIITILQVGEDRQVPFLAMQLLEGESLKATLEQDSPLPVAEVLRIGRQVAEGLAAAHARGLLHRDIKPDNIWLEAGTGRVKLLDFGLARAIDDDQHVTQTGAVVGTPKYMSPEQSQGAIVDHRTDLFSLGSVLYEMATGQAAFSGANLMATLAALSGHIPDPPHTVNPEVPREVSALIVRLLEKDPNRRMQTAGDVAESIRAIEANIAAREAARLARQATQPPRRPLSRMLIGLAAAALVALGGIVYYIKTNQGTISVEIADDSIQTLLEKDGIEVRDTQHPDQVWTISPAVPKHLPAGTYRASAATENLQLHVSNTQGVELETGEFRLERNGQVRIRVASVPEPAHPPADQETSEPSSALLSLAIAPFDAQQARQYQQAWADSLGLPVEQSVELPGGVKLAFVLIPPGEFVMGSSDAERELVFAQARANKDEAWATAMVASEGPQTRLRISEPFYLGKYEVTQAQWQAVLGSNPATTADPGYPVDNVSWDDIQPLLKKLNHSHAADDLTFILPTEAQWEYACRAGTTTPWYSGDDEAGLSEYAWDKRQHPVGQLKPNAWGLFDMHGNVWEWCSDPYHPVYHSPSSAVDATGPLNAEDRVFRGGGGQPWRNRSASRHHSAHDFQGGGTGLRLAAVIVDRQDHDAVNKPQQTQITPSRRSEPSALPAPAKAVVPFTAEQARKHQEQWAGYLGVPVKVTNSIGMQLVLIPPGEFPWTPNLHDANKPDDAWPLHSVHITQAYSIGAHEVTIGQYRRFVSETSYVTEPEQDGSPRPSQDSVAGGYVLEDGQIIVRSGPEYSWKNAGLTSGDDYPVKNITVGDAIEFCKWLSRKEQQTYRLPAAMEWEFACRAGTTTKYFFGDALSLFPRYGNTIDESALDAGIGSRAGMWRHIRGNDGFPADAPVGSFQPNPFELYDMHGNVHEMCGPSYDGCGHVQPFELDDLFNYEARGSSATDQTPVYAESNYRNGGHAAYRTPSLGFRIVREIKQDTRQ